MQRLQITVCSHFARSLSASDTRSEEDRAVDITRQLVEDSRRTTPLLDLSFPLQVSGCTCMKVKGASDRLDVPIH
jgi:hypothetical protein